MAEGVARVFIVTAQQIDKKCVLPRTPAHWPRLDLAQADIAKSKYAKRLEQSSGNVFHAEGQRGLVGMRASAQLSAADQEEAGKILLVIFYASLENPSPINLGSAPAGDGGRVRQAFRQHML